MVIQFEDQLSWLTRIIGRSKTESFKEIFSRYNGVVDKKLLIVVHSAYAHGKCHQGRAYPVSSLVRRVHPDSGLRNPVPVAVKGVLYTVTQDIYKTHTFPLAYNFYPKITRFGVIGGGYCSISKSENFTVVRR